VLRSGRKAGTQQKPVYTEEKIQSISVTLSMENDSHYFSLE